MFPQGRTLFILIAGWVLLPALMNAQETLRFSFSHYNTESGLLSNQVNSLVQDADGYLWIGGTDGLQRFDGTRYTAFRHNRNDSLSLPSNPITQLMIDKKRRLWVLLADGNVGIFNTRRFVFEKVPVKARPRSIQKAFTHILKMDEAGNIFYIFPGHEVVTWNEHNQEFSAANNFFNIDPGWAVSDFVQQPGTQKYWIGLQGKGIAVYDRSTGVLSYPGHNKGKEPIVAAFDSTVCINRTLFDRAGRAWFFCWTSVYPIIYCYNTQTHATQQYELLTTLRSYHEIFNFFEQSDGSIWTFGLKVFARFDEKENKFLLVQNGYSGERTIAYDYLTDLHEDREGNTWACTDNNGVFRFNPSREYFKSVPHVNRVSGKPGNGAPMSFMATRWGTYLVGTWEDGLYEYDSSFKMIPTNIKGIDKMGGPFIWNMFASPDSNSIWMASQPGIFQLDQARRTATFYNPPVLENKTVCHIAQDKGGTLWIGMLKTGVYRWPTVNGKIVDHTQPERFAAIASTSINKIIIDHKGMLWFATGEAGLYMVDPTTGSVLLHFEKDAPEGMRLPENPVSSVLEYNDSLMLMSTTANLFIYNRNTQRIRQVGPPDVVSGYVTAMERDEKGFVWLTTTSGLYRVALRQGAFMRFSGEGGMENDHFNLAASYKLKDGRLVFGGSDQFIVFNPEAVSNTNRDIDITITGFKVMNRPLVVDSLMRSKKIELEYDENSLEIAFSTLLYSTPALILYKLDKLDKDWKVADKTNEAIYSYLPQGEYRLLFKVVDENGNMKDSSLQLVIRVNPPFWKSWWFFCLLALFAGTLVFWLDRARMKRVAAVQKMRSDIAGNLHKEVHTALNNINILSEMARLKADTEPVKSKEFIEQIQNKSQHMIISMDDMLWSIAPENDSMQKTLDRMQEFIEALSKKYTTPVDMLVDEKVRSLKPDMQVRHEVLHLFKESVEGLQRAGATDCRIDAISDKAGLLFLVHFNKDAFDEMQVAVWLQRQDFVAHLVAIKASYAFLHEKNGGLFELKIPVQ